MLFKKVAAVVLFAGLFAFAQSEDTIRESNHDDSRIGGAGGFEIGVQHIDLTPIKDFMGKDLSIGGFNFDQNRFFSMGFLGYAGQVKNGMRIGIKGNFDYNVLYSNEWTSHRTDSLNKSDSLVDSIGMLHIANFNIGFIAEKSVRVFQNVNVYVGGMMGAGGLLVIEDRRELDGEFVKMRDPDDSLRNNSIRFAPMWVFDVHGGMTYSFTKWMHIGFDGSVLWNYSPMGFGTRYGSFWTINPGIRARIVFGPAA